MFLPKPTVSESSIQNWSIVSGWAQPRHGFCAVCFRLLLVVSLWRGPALWGHEHKAGGEDLATHLAIFHPDEPDPWNLGWHWHFSLPDSPGPLSPEGEEPLSHSCDPLPALLSDSLVTSSTGVSTPTAMSALSDHFASPDGVSHSRSVPKALHFGPLTQQLHCRMNC